MRLASIACLGLALAACAHPPRGGSEPNALDYVVRYAAEPSPVLDVTVTHQRGPNRAFLFTQPGAQVARIDVTLHSGDTTTLAIGEEGFTLPPGWASFRYRYEIDRVIAQRGQDLYTGAGRGASRQVGGRAYLARPRQVSAEDQATLRVEGGDAQLPWEASSDGAFHLRGQDLVDSGFHVFGARKYERTVGGATLRIAILEGKTRVSHDALLDWVTQAANEVLTVRRTFPRRRAVLSLLPLPDVTEASPFGMAVYSDPPSVALLVGAEAVPRELQTDWVAVHELFHLAHPVFMPPEPWLSEGLATYYTQIARMRSGRFTEEQGWRELVDGFRRGRAQSRGDTMAQVTGPSASHRFLALYWSGALVALDADLHIRTVTRGARSLDDVLERLAARGRETATLDDFARAADEVAGAPFFAELLRAHREQSAFAALPRVLGVLGIRSEGRAEMVPSALRTALGGKVTAKSSP